MGCLVVNVLAWYLLVGVSMRWVEAKYKAEDGTSFIGIRVTGEDFSM